MTSSAPPATSMEFRGLFFGALPPRIKKPNIYGFLCAGFHSLCSPHLFIVFEAQNRHQRSPDDEAICSSPLPWPPSIMSTLLCLRSGAPGASNTTLQTPLFFFLFVWCASVISLADSTLSSTGQTEQTAKLGVTDSLLSEDPFRIFDVIWTLL